MPSTPIAAAEPANLNVACAKSINQQKTRREAGFSEGVSRNALLLHADKLCSLNYPSAPLPNKKSLSDAELKREIVPLMSTK